MQKTHTWLECEGFLYEENPSVLSTAEVNKKEALAMGSGKCTSYGKMAVDFWYVKKNLLSDVTHRIDLRQAVDDFVITFEVAAKHYKVKIIEVNLYVRKMTLNDDVVSLITLIDDVVNQRLFTQ